MRSRSLRVFITATSIAFVSIGFYPTQFFAAVYHVAPFLKFVNPKTAKLTLYLSSQNIILELGIRILGRQNKEQLSKRSKQAN